MLQVFIFGRIISFGTVSLWTGGSGSSVREIGSIGGLESFLCSIGSNVIFISCSFLLLLGKLLSKMAKGRIEIWIRIEIASGHKSGGVTSELIRVKDAVLLTRLCQRQQHVPPQVSKALLSCAHWSQL